MHENKSKTLEIRSRYFGWIEIQFNISHCQSRKAGILTTARQEKQKRHVHAEKKKITWLFYIVQIMVNFFLL